MPFRDLPSARLASKKRPLIRSKNEDPGRFNPNLMAELQQEASRSS
jgi:hypothetical protein